MLTRFLLSLCVVICLAGSIAKAAPLGSHKPPQAPPPPQNAYVLLAKRLPCEKPSCDCGCAKGDPCTCAEASTPTAKSRAVTPCCSPACTCGCNEGQPCRCGAGTTTTTIYRVAPPVNYQPAPVIYQPAFQPTYQPAYQPMMGGFSRGFSGGGRGCGGGG